MALIRNASFGSVIPNSDISQGKSKGKSHRKSAKHASKDKENMMPTESSTNSLEGRSEGMTAPIPAPLPLDPNGVNSMNGATVAAPPPPDTNSAHHPPISLVETSSLIDESNHLIEATSNHLQEIVNLTQQFSESISASPSHLSDGSNHALETIAGSFVNHIDHLTEITNQLTANSQFSSQTGNQIQQVQVPQQFQ